MHEMGHTLGLRHGGLSDRNYKPNYLSVMSYSLQFPTDDPTRPLDYSNRKLATLNETDLNEAAGIGGPGGPFTVFGSFGNPANGITNGMADRAVFVRPANGPLDWNGNGIATNQHVNADVNFFQYTIDTNDDGRPDQIVSINSPSPTEELGGFDDWQNLVYNFRVSPDFADGVHGTVPLELEMTEEDVRKAAMAVDFDGDGIPNALDNCPSVFNPDQADRDGNGIGDVCDVGGALVDLALMKTVSASEVVVGSNLTYLIIVTNLGPGHATNVVVTESLPVEVNFVSASLSQGTYMLANSNVVCSFGTVSNGSSASVMVVVSVAVVGSITNTAAVSGGLEYNLGNNQGVVVVTAVPPAPPNNHFASAQAISGNSGGVSGSNVAATKESGEPNHAGNAGGHSVWFAWTAPSSGTAVFNTFGSSFDTLLAIYTGANVNGLSLIDSNDDVGSGGVSQVAFNAIAGTAYRIAVDGYGGATGNLALNWMRGPANDNFSDALTLAGSSGTVFGTSTFAGKETGEPNHAGNSGGASLWYRGVAPGSGLGTFDTKGSTFDTLLGLYTGASVNALSVVASNDDGGTGFGTTSSLTNNAIEGTVYSIAVDGYGGAKGSVVLNWQLTGRPTLSIFYTSSNTVALVWPATAPGFSVEATLTLASPNSWGTVTNPPVTVGDQKIVTLEQAGATRFFRLRSP